VASEWYFQLGESALGPVTAGSLLERAGDGRLSPLDPVRKGADGKWGRAERVQGLTFRDAGPPPIPNRISAPLVAEVVGEAGQRPSQTPSGRIPTWLIPSACFCLTLCGLWVWRAGQPATSPLSSVSSEAGAPGERQITPFDLTPEQLRTKLNGTFESDSLSWTLSYPVWKSNSTRKTFQMVQTPGVFEVVTVDAAGQPVVGGERFALLMTREDFQGQMGVVPIVPYLNADGRVIRIQIQGFSVGGLSLPGTSNHWFFMHRASTPTEAVTEEKKPGFTRSFRNE
jgi:hypothetical protein